MTEPGSWLLELRIFVVAPGDREKFHRISSDETIPLMRQHGIAVVGHGPCLDDERGYYLLRAFPSEEQRARSAREFYASEEWQANYEQPVTAMIKHYHTEVMAMPASLAALLDGGS